MRLDPTPEMWRENMQDARGGLRMIREAIETLGPPGILPSEEAVLGLHGPRCSDEATALVGALMKLLGGAQP